jgi:glycosyltransferase involved in cell wall biosynthesis
MAAKIRILFLIPSLVANGAERQLCELVRNMDPDGFEVHVVVFYDPAQCVGGDLTPEMAGLPHVRLHSLHKRRGGAGLLLALPRLLGLVRRISPELIHGYLDGNLPALMLGWPMGIPRVWGIRASASDPARLHGLSRHLFRTSQWLSRHVDLVIFNSQAGRLSHQATGLRAPNTLVIPNGFDTSRFRPDPEAGARQRQAWGIPAEAPLVGIVGRLAPVKDHPTFLRAAAWISRSLPEVRFVCVGAGPPDYAEQLRDQARILGLTGRVLWPGNSDAMAAVYNALTLLILSSTEEGFPNAIGEAMACGVPCVSTRVGDAALIIGDTGLVTDVGDAEALAEAALRLLGETGPERRARARAAEQRIRASFSTQALARSTEAALRGLVVPLPAHVPAGE